MSNLVVFLLTINIHAFYNIYSMKQRCYPVLCHFSIILYMINFHCDRSLELANEIIGKFNCPE